MPDNWCLIFSDGTGQRGVRNDAGVRNTNVFQMFAAAEGKIYLDAFYDPGLGAPEEGENSWGRTLRNLWSKATGWGISANIADCYEALLLKWRPGVKIGLFGFSRGAYTVRCLSGVLATCGIAMTDGGAPIPAGKEGEGAKRRRAIAEAAVSAYKIRNESERKAAGQAFALKYGAAPVTPDVIG
ncbi:MAG: phospholipase effector Tle1 domain-containing protein, partial [Mesorhizobium sp.]